MPHRLSTGIEGLDDLLGGGLLPGTLTAVVGSTGIGKTQFGLQFANAGLTQEGRRGIVFDLSARGDSQNHADYARRMFGWQLPPVDPERPLGLDDFFSPPLPCGDYLHVFDQHGRRVRGPISISRRGGNGKRNSRVAERLDRVLLRTISSAVFAGTVVDGIEPVERPSDSIQFELIRLRLPPDLARRTRNGWPAICSASTIVATPRR